MLTGTWLPLMNSSETLRVKMPADLLFLCSEIVNQDDLG
jgi:hypothetical protein